MWVCAVRGLARACKADVSAQYKQQAEQAAKEEAEKQAREHLEAQLEKKLNGQFGVSLDNVTNTAKDAEAKAKQAQIDAKKQADSLTPIDPSTLKQLGMGLLGTNGTNATKPCVPDAYGEAKCTDIDKMLFSFIWINGIVAVLAVISCPILSMKTHKFCCGYSAMNIIFGVWLYVFQWRQQLCRILYYTHLHPTPPC